MLLKNVGKIAGDTRREFLGGDLHRNYAFLGLPGSGKTTYFTLMANLLQHDANKSKNYKFKFLPVEQSEISGDNVKPGCAIPSFTEAAAEEFIYKCIDQVENQHWPVKTQLQDRAKYRFELAEPGKLFGTRTTTISYFDFPGELFESAFRQDKNSSLVGEDGLSVFASEFGNADGLFLVIDAERMFNKIQSRELDRILSRLFDCVKGKKIAVIFSKMDLFFGITALQDKQMMCDIFRETYSDAYAHLDVKNGECQFFTVKAFTKIDIPEDGSDPRPPKDLEYDGSLLTPVQWMTGFSLQS